MLSESGLGEKGGLCLFHLYVESENVGLQTDFFFTGSWRREIIGERGVLIKL